MADNTNMRHEHIPPCFCPECAEPDPDVCPPRVTFHIVRADTVVGRAVSLDAARRVRDRLDVEYGACVHRIRDTAGRGRI